MKSSCVDNNFHVIFSVLIRGHRWNDNLSNSLFSVKVDGGECFLSPFLAYEAGKVEDAT